MHRAQPGVGSSQFHAGGGERTGDSLGRRGLYRGELWRGQELLQLLELLVLLQELSLLLGEAAAGTKPRHGKGPAYMPPTPQKAWTPSEAREKQSVRDIKGGM